MKKKALRFIPLGGLGEIGMNSMLFEFDDNYYLIDCGVQFPDAGMLGVEYVIPDISFIKAISKKIKAIIITHGHEDHIGAIPYLISDIDAPIYTPSYPYILLRNKFSEFNLKEKHFNKLNKINQGSILSFGDITFKFINVTHSIPDSFSLLIETPLGNVVYSGDFKIDPEPYGINHFDRRRFKEIGDKGVLCLFSDSTNAEVAGHSRGEGAVYKTISTLIEPHPSRVIISMFASNIYRIMMLIDVAHRTGRKISLIGRSLYTYLKAAEECGIIKFPWDEIVPVDKIKSVEDKKLLIFSTGSQAEKHSVLVRAGLKDHPQLEIKNDDLIILSSRIIPGNEKAIYRMINNLSKLGASVLYEKIAPVHATGHACRDEMKELLQLLRPRFFVPIHGEYSFLIKHGETAREWGVEKSLVAENGNVIKIGDDIKIEDKIPLKMYFVDGPVVGDEMELHLDEKKKLGWRGTILTNVKIFRLKKGIKADITLSSYGCYTDGEKLLKDAEGFLKSRLEQLSVHTGKNEIEECIETSITDFFKRAIQKKPVVLKFVEIL